METLLYTLILISALMVLSSKNPVHSVLFLVLAFCNSAALMILWKVEFLALLLLVVYVGAIAILFLFVVMMLNLSLVELAENQLKYLPLGAVIILVFFLELFILSEEQNLNSLKRGINYLNWDQSYQTLSSIQLFGKILYTDFAYLIILVSFILLLAMLGALILTPKKV